ncbi:MAG: histidine kinase [Frankiales bacterium]|nr:histidine kinase [Frankiales bacterium]
MSRLNDAARTVRTRWRRSLQLRVVGTTLIVSGVVMLLLATLLIRQVGSGLVKTKTSTSLSEAQAGVAQAQTRLDNLDEVTRTAVDAALTDVVQQISTRGAAGDLYSVIAVSTRPDGSAFASAGVDLEDVPADLLRSLREDQGAPRYQYAVVPDGSGGRVQGLVIGSVLRSPDGQQYLLFHLFPLTAERSTLGLVQRTSAAAGAVLVLLLALIAYLVARQVVRPVRQAAATAEKLAAGRLEERILVRGEDELARLGATFNTMADALQAQIRQLEDLSRVQRRFVSDVSHELRTPLTTVRMAADLLHEARETFPPDTRRSAELLQTELNRFEEMLVDLLEISRYDAGATSLDAEVLDLVELVSRVLDHTRGLADHRGTELVLRTVGDLPVLVEADHVRVQRILRNLLVNALEHGEGRPVEIVVAGNETAVAVVVRDRGVGFREADTERVFTRFWRGDPSRARTTGGTGLGLAIALEDARLHGGLLDAWGRPGEGASFRLVLPRKVGGRFRASPLELREDEVTR